MTDLKEGSWPSGITNLNSVTESFILVSKLYKRVLLLNHIGWF